jgi:hypothetical protein
MLPRSIRRVFDRVVAGFDQRQIARREEVIIATLLEEKVVRGFCRLANLVEFAGQRKSQRGRPEGAEGVGHVIV